MRLGQNPAKSIDSLPESAKVTVAVVTYIPFLAGYYADSLNVLKACLGSIWQNTPRIETGTPFEVLVFDNASCKEVRAYLHEMHNQGKIQYLVLSDKNVGKGGGWNFIFQGAPGELIAYADSDIYFYPGWLEASLEILNTYPNVGMVTARPLRTHERYFTATLDWAHKTPKVQVEQGEFMSWSDFKEHTDSMGISEELGREWYEKDMDTKITYHGVTTYAGAAHFQFMGHKSTLQSLFPIQMNRPMGQVRSLDEKLNDAGLLRLNTCTPLVRHLGNVLPSDIKSSEGKNSISSQKPTRLSPGRRLASIPVVRRSMLKIYDKIFRLLYSE